MATKQLDLKEGLKKESLEEAKIKNLVLAHILLLRLKRFQEIFCA